MFWIDRSVPDVTVIQRPSADWKALTTAPGAPGMPLPIRSAMTPSWSKCTTCHSIRRNRVSSIARSIHSPSNSGSVACRYTAACTANAPIRAVTVSAWEKPVCTGGPSGNPVM